MDDRKLIPTADLVQVARGFLMGGADIIPGVSGGTVALILGVYERLVSAISRFDSQLVVLLLRRDWKAAADHVDLRFLVALGGGIGLGIASLATLMHYLLDHQLQYTFSFFTGLILASSVLVAKMVRQWGLGNVLLLLAGAIGAYEVVGLPMMQSPPQSELYTFFCGMVGICAMILPGISGAFILLIMGKYKEITGLIKDFLHFQFSLEAVTTLVVFAAGMAVGLIAFSKFLKWLLARHEPQTMAVLCGFMVGSLRKLWPFKEDQTPEQAEFKLKEFVNVWPASFGGVFWTCIGLMVAAAALVLLLDFLTSGSDHDPGLELEVE
jgi:putative membrane protein